MKVNQEVTDIFEFKFEDFKIVEDWATREVVPLRNKFAPKSHTFTCELDARFEFGGKE